MKAIRTSVVLSLLLTLAAGTALITRADDEPAKQDQETPATPPDAPPAPDAPSVIPPVAPPATPAVTPPVTRPVTPSVTRTLPPASKKPVQQQLVGTVVAVNRFTKDVTLQVNNLSYVLQITDSTRVSKNGEERNINDVVVGEEIKVNVLLRELPNGRVEVAVLSVELPVATAAQGDVRGPKFTQPPPFQNGPNPANIDGPIISPNR